MSNAAATAVNALNKVFIRQYPGEVAEWLGDLPAREATAAVLRIPVNHLAAVWEKLPPHVARSLLTEINLEQARHLLSRIDPADAASALRSLDPERRDQYLERLDPLLGKELQRLMHYPPDSAGALMDAGVITFKGNAPAQATLRQLRRHRDQVGREVFIVDDEGRLEGSVDLQDLALSPPKTTLSVLARPVKVAVDLFAAREEIAEILERHKVSELPVLDAQQRLVGLIRYDALISAVQNETSADIQTMVGASKDERALSPIRFAVRKRLPWLQINLATAFLASAVVGLFEGTIARITALAVLSPIVAGQAGNAGAQALAVTMRGLALREISAHHWIRMLYKEMSTGFLNGVAVALTTGLCVYLWSRSFNLAAVIATAMVLSMVAAGFAGAIIPLILTVLDQDPAQSSTIILTTITDCTGFGTFLGIATFAASMGWLH
jgi:magnesium transporter